MLGILNAMVQTSFRPTNAREAAEAVLAAPRVIAVGAQTKARLSKANAVNISTLSLRGIVEYEPSEFTFTALAGTPVGEIAATLAERGQYMPFDPMLVEAGATLGGTIASGLSGPGRFRFGGVRDFILGIRFVDGAGRLLHMGGKVVKNAAGFDLPKFFCGSLGRFGLLVEATFKVFPQPAARLTLLLETADPDAAVKAMTAAGNSRWELDALDYLPDQKIVAFRLAGPTQALPELAREILARWPGRTLPEEDAETFWDRLREFHWAQADSSLVKVPLSPASLVNFMKGLGEAKTARAHFSAGGNVAFVSLAADEIAVFDRVLQQNHLPGLMLRGEAPLWLGRIDRPTISASVKQALDPENRYPSLYD
jgi:glycolate oxidase FAD binding subunit